MGELCAAACGPLASGPRAGQGRLPVLGVGGGEVPVERLEVRRGQATQTDEGRRVGHKGGKGDHSLSLHQNGRERYRETTLIICAKVDIYR